MKAVVFAAGLGTRLKPFTDTHPKALAPVGSSTALGLVLKKLVDAGADAIVVNVHHFASQVIEYITALDLPVHVEISDETSLLLDTGGALAKIYRESDMIANMAEDEPLVVHNADILTDFPLTDIADRMTGNAAAILVDPQRQSSRKLMFDSNWMLRGWLNKAKQIVKPTDLCSTGLTEAAFGGVHALSKKCIRRLSDYCGPLHPFSIIDFYIDECHTLPFTAYIPDTPYQWYDIGNPERLEAAQVFAS